MAFQTSDFVADRPAAVAEAMLDVIIAFARLDTALSGWLITAFGMSLDRGAILVENMDVGNKIGRLRSLYEHDGHSPETVKRLKDTKKEFDKQRVIRNTIAHASFVGVLKGQPDVAVFSPARAFKGLPDQMEILQIHVDLMKSATAWAGGTANAVYAVMEHVEAGERLG